MSRGRTLKAIAGRKWARERHETGTVVCRPFSPHYTKEEWLPRLLGKWHTKLEHAKTQTVEGNAWAAKAAWK
jgi:hypothetical protein